MSHYLLDEVRRVDLEHRREQWLAYMKREAKKAGYTHLHIGKGHPDWPTVSDASVFAWPKIRSGNWPAIWEVLRNSIAGQGCGNGLKTSDQGQASDYELVSYFSGKTYEL